MGQAAGSKPFPKAAAASAVVGMLLLGVLSTFSLEGIIGQSERYRD